jgi:outer membrane protein assembly factor BamB
VFPLASTFDQPTGFYWKFPTADQIVASPVSFGNLVFVASTDSVMYALDMRSGSEIWAQSVTDALRATPASAEVRSAGVGGQGGGASLVIAGDTAGTVYMLDVTTGQIVYEFSVEGGVVGSPLIIDDRVVVTGSDADSAQIVSMRALPPREEVWRYPLEGDEPLPPVRGAVAYHDGIIYVPIAGPGLLGGMIMLDEATGGFLCETLPIGRVEVNPVIVDDVVYVLTTAGQMFTYNVGSCRPNEVEGRHPYYNLIGAGAAPAIAGNLMVLPVGPRLVAIDLTNLNPRYDVDWAYPTGTAIAAAPVIADGKVYAGDGAGVLHVLDLVTGEVLWTWDTGSRILSSPLVMDDVVIVTGTNGVVVAIGAGVPLVPVETTTTAPDDTGTTTGDTTTTTQGETTTTTRGEPVVTTIIPPTGVGGAQ